MEILKSEERTAKRRHTRGCDECRKSIDRGARFRVTTIVDVGSVHRYKLCARCARWADLFADETGECEWSQGDVDQFRYDYLRDYLGVRKRRVKG
jgi:hypothetical protein